VYSDRINVRCIPCRCRTIPRGLLSSSAVGRNNRAENSHHPTSLAGAQDAALQEPRIGSKISLAASGTRLMHAHHLCELKALIDIDKEQWAGTRSNGPGKCATFSSTPTKVSSWLSPRGDGAAHARSAHADQTLHRHRPAPARLPSKPPPLARQVGRGQAPHRPGHNPLIRLHQYKHDVLRFLYDFAVPLNNNEAGRDLRMMKVKLKISAASEQLPARGPSLPPPLESRVGTSSKPSPQTQQPSSRPHRYDEEGEAGLLDRRLGRASGKRVPVDQAEEVEALYRERYQDFTVKHFHEHLVKDHGFGSWLHLDEAAPAVERACGEVAAHGRASPQARAAGRWRARYCIRTARAMNGSRGSRRSISL
jgi:Transposase IS66 family